MRDATPFIDPDATADALSAQVAALPDDPALLKHLLDARLAEIERLKLLVAKLRHAQFGRRSERLGALSGQLDLGLSTAQQGGGEARGASAALAALADILPIDAAHDTRAATGSPITCRAAAKNIYRAAVAARNAVAL
jgi:hypothetical protein